ncbi:MAG: hypothetical protein V4714_11745 [Bacteroidota bacterium]
MLFFLILLAFDCSSDTTKKMQKSEIISIQRVEKTAQIEQPKKTNTVMALNKDSLLWAYQVLLKTGIINSKFPINKLLFYKDYFAQDNHLLLIKIDYDENIKYKDSSITNCLIICNGDSIGKVKAIDSINEDDFIYKYNHNGLSIFSYYSSPVGYIEYYILDNKNQKLYVSEQIYDSEDLDTLSIDLRLMSVRAIKLKTSEAIPLKLTLLQWD